MDFKKISFGLVFLVILVTFFLGGCATPYDVDIAQENTKRVVSNDGANKSIVLSKTTAIVKVSSYDCADPNSRDCGTAKAFSNVFGMQAIAGIKVEQYKGPVDKTGVEVQYKVAENGVPLAAVTGGTITSTAAVRSDRGTVSNTSSGGSTINNSYDEDHATNTGNDASNGNYPAQNNSTESVAVDAE